MLALESLRKQAGGRRGVLPALLYIQVLALLRNTLLARLLGPEQFGIAVTFLLAQQFIEMSTDTGLNKIILQSQSGNRSSLQATVQAIAAVRGVVIALLIVGLAWPIFNLINPRYEVAPFFVLAGASLAMGFLHYDNARQQRNGVFANDSLSNVLGETCGLLACLVAILYTRTYVVVLLGILARSMVVSLVSHLMARRRYRLRIYRHWTSAIFVYSWPLLINGPLLFLSTQSDRILVSTLLGLRELGIYSAALLLLMLPLALLTRVLGTLFVPRLSQAHHSGSIEPVEAEFAGVCLTVAVVAACGFAAIGPTALRVLYGEAYAQAVFPVALIGLAQSMRFLRTWPLSIAIATAKTGNVLLSTGVRLLALPLGLVGILIGGGISGLASGMLAGEVLALVASFLMLNRARGLPYSHGMAGITVMIAVSVLLPSALLLTSASAAEAAGIAAAILLLALLGLHRIDRRLVPRNLSAFGW